MKSNHRIIQQLALLEPLAVNLQRVMTDALRGVLIVGSSWLIVMGTPVRGGIVFTTLATFNGTNGSCPCGGLVQGNDGNFYGTTSTGGANNQGTVFRMTGDGTITTLFSFNGTNGSGPQAGLDQGNDGNFYGTTRTGGTNIGNLGTVFSITTNGVFNSLASFAGTNGFCVIAGLVQGTDGNFYGTASRGGAWPFMHWSLQYGTVFKVAPDGPLTVVYAFGPFGQKGGTSREAMIRGNDGTLYGTSLGNQDTPGGTIFKITTNDTFSTLVSFPYNAAPENQFVQAIDGNFYGRASGGVYGWGTVYRMTVSGNTGTLTTLVSFNGTNGSDRYGVPIDLFGGNGAMVQGADGNLYGTTICGGSAFNPSVYNYGVGTIFQVNTNGTLTTLYSFSGGSNGGYPVGLIIGSDGNFYGATYGGGIYSVGDSRSAGTVFRLSVPLQPVFQTATVTNGEIILCWTAAAGQTYQMQFNADLTTTNWSNLGDTIIATNGMMVTYDSMGSDEHRFYRVVVLP
jgi:uncharacterized repeat protein (TIGR03803 family)